MLTIQKLAFPGSKIAMRLVAVVFVLLGLSGQAHSVATGCVASGGANCTALIPDGPRPGLSSTLTVPAGVCGAASATQVSVNVNLTHSWIGDLNLVVKNPANQSVTLLNALPSAPSVGCAGDDINATFQDGAAAPACNAATVPSLSGTVAPASSLAPLLGSVSGTWTLVVTDTINGNNGALNDWSVDISCVQLPPADMAVTISGFPSSAPPGSTVNGTLTCTNVGGQTASNVTCSVAGGTSSSCALQPGNTPVTFPVASVAAGQSITCNVSTTAGSRGEINLVGQTSASNDGNAANNSVLYAAAGLISVPTLSGALLVVLAALLLLAVAITSRQRRQ